MDLSHRPVPAVSGKRPPGPAGDRWAGVLPAYEADRLGFLMDARETYGAVVAFDARTTVVNDLALARRVLDPRAGLDIVGNFLNEPVPPDRRAARDRLRRHLNAGLRRPAVLHLGAAAAAGTIAALEQAGASTNRGLDPLPAFESALSGAVAELYFGPDSRPVREQMAHLLEALGSVFGNLFALPARWPTPANLRVRRAYRALRRVVDPLVAARAEGWSHNDFAAGVARSARAEGHRPEAVANLLIGSLLAAQRVPAAAASWALLDLARHPAWAAEARKSTGALRAVLRESMRLHPPTWLLRRVAVRPVGLGGYEFPAGHTFLVSPYVVHRDERLYDDAAAFRPERWTSPDVLPPEPLTFGRGLHLCPGRDTAGVMLEAALQAVLARWDLSDESSGVRPDPRTTLVPAGLRLGFRASPVAAGRADLLDPLREALPRGLT